MVFPRPPIAAIAWRGCWPPPLGYPRRAPRSAAVMSRPTLIRALLALAILTVSGWIALTKPARLGLDLRGGTQIVLQTRDTATAKADEEATDRTLEVLRRRVDALGVAEPTLTRSGERRIIV